MFSNQQQKLQGKQELKQKEYKSAQEGNVQHIEVMCGSTYNTGHIPFGVSAAELHAVTEYIITCPIFHRGG